MPVMTAPPGGLLIRGRVRAQIRRLGQVSTFVLNANTASAGKTPPLPFLTGGNITTLIQVQAMVTALLAATVPVPPPV
jgi:hypothetical protein